MRQEYSGLVNYMFVAAHPKRVGWVWPITKKTVVAVVVVDSLDLNLLPQSQRNLSKRFNS